MFMFGRFTERAQKVLVLAQEEARRFNHSYVGTEHLLLGLVRRERYCRQGSAVIRCGIKCRASAD